MRFVFFIFILMFGLFSCKKEIQTTKVETVSLADIAFFGCQKGNYIEYDVIHILHDDEVDIHDTVKYKLKTLIGDTLFDNQGRLTNRFFRYIWDDKKDSWNISDVWTIGVYGKNGEIIEENERIIRLTFPIKENFSWNPNTFNTKAKETYTYYHTFKPTEINNQKFDSTLIVVQNDYHTLVDYQKQQEIYAKNIGMISRYYKKLRIKNFDTLQVKTGEEWFFTLTKFGKE